MQELMAGRQSILSIINTLSLAAITLILVHIGSYAERSVVVIEFLVQIVHVTCVVLACFAQVQDQLALYSTLPHAVDVTLLRR